MNKILQRLLTFFIGIPLVLGIIFLDPSETHIGINVLTIVFSLLAALELYSLFSKKFELKNKILIVSLCLLQPALTFLLFYFKLDINYSYWMYLIGVFLLLSVEVFSQKVFDKSLERLASSVFILFYAGFLFSFIPRMTCFKESKILIALFLFTVFINDSLAWFFGVLFGKNNRGIVAASPNKSVAGFLGGYLGAILSCLLAQKLWPEIFSTHIFKPIILGFLCATASIIGDLIESVFKRSSEIKDSGNIIPGRGGILDSVDSILFTAPVYYILVCILFNPEFI
ncbi:MAG: phosphatidate cytidylyltransferase [Treponema sp.]|nr:phosphatidate cytidylyltransferase [Treponema sp.]